MSGSISDRRGATLPLVILFLVLLSISAVAGLGRMSAERRTGGNLRAEVDAFTLAQAGLGRYLSVVTGPPGASLDTTITSVQGGSVAVSVRRLRAAGGGLPALYVVRATSSHTSTIRYDARTPAAARAVAQFATWEPGSMDVLGAWTSLTGLDKNGGSGTLAGADQCGVEPAVAGVAVPTIAADGGPGYDQNGGSSVPSGTPPIVYPAANPPAFAPLVEVDWDGIVNGGALTAQYNLTGTTGWPSDFTNWPTIYVNNSTELALGPGNSGRGLLVVRRDMRMNGSFSWDGVILVGGALTSNGNQTIQGAVMSGLNLKLGEAVATSDIGNGNKTVRYNSCNVSDALEGLGSLRVIVNAWADNWPIY